MKIHDTKQVKSGKMQMGRTDNLLMSNTFKTTCESTLTKYHLMAEVMAYALLYVAVMSHNLDSLQPTIYLLISRQCSDGKGRGASILTYPLRLPMGH